MCTLSAQNKKEMIASITELQTKVAELQAITAQQNRTIDSLNLQLSGQKAILSATQQNISLLSQQQELFSQQLALLKEQSGQQPKAPKLETARDSVADFVVKYLSTENWEDLLPLIMEPERMKPIMQQFYQQKGYGAENKDFNEIRNSVVKIKSNLYKVNLWDDYFVVKTDDGYKVDWEATMMHWMANLNELLETQSLGATKTVWLKLYRVGSNIDNLNRYSSSYPSGKYYTRVGTSIDQQMQKLLINGDRQVVVKVKVNKAPDTKYKKGEKYLEIIELVRDGWSNY